MSLYLAHRRRSMARRSSCSDQSSRAAGARPAARAESRASVVLQRTRPLASDRQGRSLQHRRHAGMAPDDRPPRPADGGDPEIRRPPGQSGPEMVPPRDQEGRRGRHRPDESLGGEVATTSKTPTNPDSRARPKRWPNPAEGAALRELRTVLDKVDTKRDWGALRQGAHARGRLPLALRAARAGVSRPDADLTDDPLWKSGVTVSVE